MSVSVSRMKTQTRRMWSEHTPAAGRYMFRMRKAYEEGLFLRAWCGGKLIGWVVLTGWDSEPMGDMKEGDLVRERYGGKTRTIFFEKEFKGVSHETTVLVISFLLFPSVCCRVADEPEA